MAEVHRLVGVYDADGSLSGEIRYVLGKVTGRAHCALCDITHGMIRRRPAYDEAVSTLPVPLDLVHLDERSPAEEAVSDGRTPCVLADTDEGLVLLMGPQELDACEADPARFVAAVGSAVTTSGLHYGPRP